MLQQQKEELIELFGQHFENLYHLAPLGSRILGTLIVDGCTSGITFEELVERTGASKSSVSSNLNLLLNLNIINDFNKIDERKRFFVMNEKYMKIRFQEIIEKMERELLILENLKKFRNTQCEVVLQKFDIYTSLFNKNISIIQETLDQL